MIHKGIRSPYDAQNHCSPISSMKNPTEIHKGKYSIYKDHSKFPQECKNHCENPINEENTVSELSEVGIEDLMSEIDKYQTTTNYNDSS